ncbi:MAG: hypothetical protein SO253_00415 [Bacilli bacterium]|nr:hypothetical protein [Bacilli bacterium]
MTFWEILLIIIIISFVSYIFGKEIYKKIKHQPTGECACCSMKNKRMIKEMRKAVKKDCKR